MKLRLFPRDARGDVVRQEVIVEVRSPELNAGKDLGVSSGDRPLSGEPLDLDGLVVRYGGRFRPTGLTERKHDKNANDSTGDPSHKTALYINTLGDYVKCGIPRIC